jgi:hypothetical protein
LDGGKEGWRVHNHDHPEVGQPDVVLQEQMDHQEQAYRKKALNLVMGNVLLKNWSLVNH